MSTRTFNEQPIKTVVGELLANQGGESSKKEIMCEIIKLQRSTAVTAEAFFNGMVMLGLENCKLEYRYDIKEFANMRHYFTHDEIKHLTSIQNRVRHRRR